MFVQTAWRNVPEEPNLQQERCGSRNSGAVCSVVVVGNEFLYNKFIISHTHHIQYNAN